jgi:hypothetical protein
MKGSSLSISNEQIAHLKRLKIENPSEFTKEVKTIEQDLFKKYCFKSSYKTECEPFCVDAFTGKCQYLIEMKNINSI